MWDGFSGFLLPILSRKLFALQIKAEFTIFCIFARFCLVLLWLSFAFICLLDAFICLAFLFALSVCIFMSLALAAV